MNIMYIWNTTVYIHRRMIMPTIRVRTKNDVIEMKVHESQIKCLDNNVEFNNGDRLDAEYIEYLEK